VTTTSINDFKGNVDLRPPLDGGADYDYDWDAYDRLTTATRSGSVVLFHYDALGRMLLRDDGASTRGFYWLGLLPIAEEEWSEGRGRGKLVQRRHRLRR
jgi:YD repeat-containing protein